MKLGTQVKFTRRNGETATGKVIKKLEGKSGNWLAINTSPPNDIPKITKIRESQAVPV